MATKRSRPRKASRGKHQIKLIALQDLSHQLAKVLKMLKSEEENKPKKKALRKRKNQK